MKQNKEIFIFYNLLAIGSLILGFSIAIYLVQNLAINPYKINAGIIMILISFLFIANYYFFGKKVQKLFERSF